MRKLWLDNLRWATVLPVPFYVIYFYNKGVSGGVGGFADAPMCRPQNVVILLSPVIYEILKHIPFIRRCVLGINLNPTNKLKINN